MATTPSVSKQFVQFIVSHPGHRPVNHDDWLTCAVGDFARQSLKMEGCEVDPNDWLHPRPSNFVHLIDQLARQEGEIADVRFPGAMGTEGTLMHLLNCWEPIDGSYDGTYGPLAAFISEQPHLAALLEQ